MQLEVLGNFNKLARPLPGPIRQAVILGLDVSLNNTGVAVLHNGKVRTFSIGKGTEVSSITRLAYFKQEFTDLLDRYDPDMVLLEGYSFASANSRAHSIGELGGILKLAIREWTLRRGNAPRVYTVPPTTLKKAVRGIGKGDKKAMKADMLSITGLTFPDSDQCDATALALVGLALIEPSNSILKDHCAMLPNKKGSSPLEQLF